MDCITNRGNVDDIRCSLEYLNPVSEPEILKEIKFLKHSLSVELEGQKRKVVCKLIEIKIRKLKKALSKCAKNTK